MRSSSLTPGPGPVRRTPLAPGRPPARRVPLGSSGMVLERARPLAPVSARRAGESPERDAVRALVVHRDGGCLFHAMARAVGAVGRCRGPVNAHEVLKRSRGGSHLDPANCVALCDWANGWVEDEPAAAEALGLSVPSWPALDPATRDSEAAWLRARVFAGAPSPGVPSWRVDDGLWVVAARAGLMRAGWPPDAR